MKQQVFLLLTGSSNANGSGLHQSCSGEWDQCGGLSWAGPTSCCDENLKCIAFSSYYSQCLADNNSASSRVLFSPSPSTSPLPEESPCSALYGQCGGHEWAGPTCCIESVCIYNNLYYSQCLDGSPTQSFSCPNCVKSLVVFGDSICDSGT